MIASTICVRRRATSRIRRPPDPSSLRIAPPFAEHGREVCSAFDNRLRIVFGIFSSHTGGAASLTASLTSIKAKSLFLPLPKLQRAARRSFPSELQPFDPVLRVNEFNIGVVIA